MKIVKGILVYFVIALAAVVMLGILVLGTMFIAPSFHLFGYGFQNKNLKKVNFNDIEIYGTYDGGKMSTGDPTVKLTVIGGNYDVNISPNQNENNVITVALVNDYFGFVKMKKSTFEPTITKEISLESNILNVKIILNQPTGLVSYRDSKLNITVPYGTDEEKVKYITTVETGDGDINLFNSTKIDGTLEKPLYVTALNITTNRGKAKMSGLRVKENDKENIIFDYLNIVTKGGEVDFSAFNEIRVKHEKLTLNSTRADYIFKNLVADKGLDVLGTNVRLTADSITCSEGGFLFKSDSGSLTIGILNSTGHVRSVSEETVTYTNDSNTEINENTILTNSADIQINEVLGKTGIENEYGKIYIKHMSHQASIKNVHGNVNIDTSGYLLDSAAKTDSRKYTTSSSLIIYNTFGNITVGKYYQNGIFYNEKGTITAVSDFNQPQDDSDDEFYYTKAETKDGDMNIISAKNPVNLKASDKANITLKINHILYNHGVQNYTATTNKGNIYATLPTGNSAYSLLATGKLSGNLGSYKTQGSGSNIVSGVKLEEINFGLSPTPTELSLVTLSGSSVFLTSGGDATT